MKTKSRSLSILASASAAAVGEHHDHPRRGQHTNDLDHTDPLFAKRDGPMNPSDQYVEFVITPPARNDRLAEETAFVTVEDIEEISHKVKGAPLINEHLAGEVLGRIVSTRIDDQKRIVARVHMEDTVGGWNALDDIRSGKVAGVSLGQRFATQDTEDMPLAVTAKMPLELSLTTDPEFDEHTWAISSTKNSEEHERIKEELSASKHPDEEAILQFHGKTFFHVITTNQK